nr:immunoglobulin heavy chain junction region [Mus musculus]MBK4197709.1 immunoglobulin heavy chain junction region [Mus musculus]MBK4197710.1 immunoglobulin heavy chain junction region [Mus musculus]
CARWARDYAMDYW